MTICGSQNCGCALTSSTLVVSGNGTPGSPWVVEQAEFDDITQLQIDVDNLEAAMALLPNQYVNVTGDTMTGTLAINAASASLSLLRTGDTPFMQFMRQDGTRIGYIQGSDSVGILTIVGDTGYGVRFSTNNTYRGQIDTSGNVMFTKSTTGTANTGTELTAAGSVLSTRADAGGQNIVSNKTSTGDANGEVHLSVRASGTQIGSITRATASTTAYNTSSDERAKENIVTVPDDLALLWLQLAEPFLYNFINEPGNTTVGFVAQRLAAAWPQALDYGVVNTGNGLDPDHPDFIPWSIDYGKITPFLTAAVRVLQRKVAANSAEIIDLREQIMELREQVQNLNGVT
jgi:hypothetical protein